MSNVPRSHRDLDWRSDDWNGCRGVTNRIIDTVVWLRHPKWGPRRRRLYRRLIVTSRKRTETFGNPGSDHHVSQTNADAVDFRFLRKRVRYSVMKGVMRDFGVQDAQDFVSYLVPHHGVRYRIQPIAALHGTGPHNHFGVRR